jgi:hypothetical protein
MVQVLLKILGEEVVAFYQGMGQRPRKNVPARRYWCENVEFSKVSGTEHK